MPKECQICGKTSHPFKKRIKLRGKYNPGPITRRHPNLQWVTVPEKTTRKAFKEYAGKRIKACTKCIKTLSKKK